MKTEMTQEDWNKAFAEFNQATAQEFVPASEDIKVHGTPKADAPQEPLERLHRSISKYPSTQIRAVYEMANYMIDEHVTGVMPLNMMSLQRYWIEKNYSLVLMARSLSRIFIKRAKDIKSLEPDLRKGRKGGYFGTIIIKH